MDVLLIEPNASSSYQALAADFSAIETPTWLLLLAGAIKNRGLSVSILDANAERLSPDAVAQRTLRIGPKLVIVSCYGQNPNSSTPFFAAALAVAKSLKTSYSGYVGVVGPHVAALPVETLQMHDEIDLVLCNEGIYQILSLLERDFKLKEISGIAYRDDSGKAILNPPQEIVSQADLEKVYTNYAWDLLPYKQKPLDLYRSHLWHADFGNIERSPFAAIYTSLGCTFRCSFCMINMINRNSNAVVPIGSNFNKMRFFSAEWLRKEFDWLRNAGVKTLRISDEMFYLNRTHYKPILDLLIAGEYGFHMWAYSRVDTIKTEYLSDFKNAGINWLCLGIEAGDDKVRSDVFKGKFLVEQVKESVKKVQDAGIKVLANFIVGLPHDDELSIKKTFDLAIELNAEYANFYPCMALPGTELFEIAKQKNITLPDSYSGYGFLSYDCIPLPTEKLTSREVLALRDGGFTEYIANGDFRSNFRKIFGIKGEETLNELAAIPLKRKLLEK